MPLLEIHDLVKIYPGVRAVDGLSLDIEEGVCFGLLGPNGAGKTTTVEIVEGVTPATSGTVLFRGRPIDKEFTKTAGIQFQQTALQDFLKVREVLRLFQQLYSHHLELEEVTEMCSLGELLEREARKLSGGQKQRLLLALALINDPTILFLDEPTTGLDPQARHNFWELIRTIQKQGKTIVMTTHYMEEAYALCDEIAIMDHGRIIAGGPPKQLLEDQFEGSIIELPKSDFAADESFPWPWYENGDQIEIQTSDVNATIEHLIREQVPLQQLQVKSRTLEDLFLELTGSELRT